VHGNSDKSKMDWFRETADRALADRMRPNGKGSRWRTLPTENFRDNYDDIFRKTTKTKKETK
jgi:hypothetical protein